MNKRILCYLCIGAFAFVNDRAFAWCRHDYVVDRNEFIPLSGRVTYSFDPHASELAYRVYNDSGSSINFIEYSLKAWDCGGTNFDASNCVVIAESMPGLNQTDDINVPPGQARDYSEPTGFAFGFSNVDPRLRPYIQMTVEKIGSRTITCREKTISEKIGDYVN